MLNNGQRSAETQLALAVALDAIAYLTIVAATMSVGSPGAEYTPAWLHISDFLARAERQLATIDPAAAVELRTKIRENAAFLHDSLNQDKSKDAH